MRKILLILAVAMACSVGFALWKMRTVVSRSVTELAEAVAIDSNAEVTTGKVSLALFPPAVEVHDVSVTATGPSGKPIQILTAPRVRVTPKLMPVFVGQVIVREAEAIEPTLLVRKLVADRRRFYRLPLDDVAQLDRPSFPISVRDGTLRIDDRTFSPIRKYELNGIDLRVSPPTADGAWVFDVSGPVFGEASHAQAAGTVVPGAGRSGGPGLDITYSIRDAQPEEFTTLFPLLDGTPFTDRLSFDGVVRGNYGERGDENAPAEPLLIEARGTTGFVFADVPDELAFELTSELHEKQIRIKNGAIRWGEVPFDITGYMGTWTERKLAVRLIATDADVAATLATVGVPERWRPRATLSGMMRVTGTMREPLVRYEATSADVAFDGFDSLPIRAKDLRCTGSVLAINADVSASCSGAEVRAATATLTEPSFGLTYWRDQLRLVLREFPLWDGKGDLIVSYSTEQDSVQGGGFIDDMDVAVVAQNIVPKSGIELEGRMDSVYQIGFDARGPWVLGRVGVHRGRVQSLGMVRDVIDAVLDARDSSDAIQELAAAHERTLADGRLEFRRLAFDFETREEGIALRALTIAMEGADFRGEGLIGFDRSVALWGNVVLSEALTADLATAASGVAPLVAADGRLRIPVKIHGTSDDPSAAPDERFMEALVAAARGNDVGPFVPMEPDTEIVTDLPSLREHFYR